MIHIFTAPKWKVALCDNNQNDERDRMWILLLENDGVAAFSIYAGNYANVRIDVGLTMRS